MLKKLGCKEATITWLQSHKSDIENASKAIETPLAILVGMHQCLLKETAKSDEMPSKRIKIEPK
jgi:hypothetical protein